MRNKLTIIYMLFVLLISCSREAGCPFVIERCSPLPVGRSSATCFSYSGKCYVFGGRNDSNDYHRGFLSDCWCYDPVRDSWSPLSDLPCKARTRGAAIVIGDDLYFGLGFNGCINIDSCYLRDWWRCDMLTGSWTRLADFPATDTNMPVVATCDGKIYTLFGTHSGSSRLIYEYDISSDSWSRWDDDWHIAELGGTTGQQIEETCYVSGGYFLGMLNDSYAVNLRERRIRRRRSMPDGGRLFASSAVIKGHLYFFGGRHIGGTLTTEKIYNDILEYDISADRWRVVGALPFEGREQMCATTIGDIVFFGLGEDRDLAIYNDWYRWEKVK